MGLENPAALKLKLLDGPLRRENSGLPKDISTIRVMDTGLYLNLELLQRKTDCGLAKLIRRNHIIERMRTRNNLHPLQRLMVVPPLAQKLLDIVFDAFRVFDPSIEESTKLIEGLFIRIDHLRYLVGQGEERLLIFFV